MKKWIMIVAVLAAVLGAGAWLRGGGSDQAPQLAFSSLAVHDYALPLDSMTRSMLRGSR